MRAGRDWGRWPLNVRFGSKADMGLAAVDVRYSPKSGHGLTHFKKRKQHGSRTRKQVNRWGCGGIWRKGGHGALKGTTTSIKPPPPAAWECWTGR